MAVVSPLDSVVSNAKIEQRYTGGLEVVPFENLDQNEFLSPKEIMPERYDDQWPEPIHEIGPSTPASSPSQKETESQSAKDQKPGWRHNRRFLTILALIGAVVLCAVVGGVLGYFMSGKGQNNANDLQGEGNSGNSTGNNQAEGGIQISSTSRLTATNWTDWALGENRAVYFQDETDALITRKWSARTGWETYNITENILSNRSLAATVSSGTVLATSTSAFPAYPTDYGRYLYFIDTDGYFRCYRSWTDYTANHDEWEIWERSLDQSNDRVLAGSSLAATTYYDHSQTREIRTLAFQNSDGRLVIANDSTNWGDPQMVHGADDANRPTTLAFSNFVDGDDTSLDLAWLRQPDGGYIKMTVSGMGDGRNDSSTESLDALDTTLNNQGRTEMAVTSWDGGSQALWLILQTNGDVEGVWRDGDTNKNFDQIRFEGYDDDPSPSWQSIAAADDGWLYGITNGRRILEYKLDDTDRDLFHFSSVVL